MAFLDSGDQHLRIHAIIPNNITACVLQHGQWHNVELKECTVNNWVRIKETVKKRTIPSSQAPYSHLRIVPLLRCADLPAHIILPPCKTHNLHQKDSRKSHASGPLLGKSGSVVRTAWERRKWPIPPRCVPIDQLGQMLLSRPHSTTLSALGIHALAQDICSCGCQ
jgi:hypothetical protein